MGSLDVDWSSWRRVAWIMAGVVMAMLDRRHVAVEHGGEVEWVRSWCSTIWASLGLAGRPELGAGLCVELRLVHGTELK